MLKYWLIPLLPFAAFLVAGLFGRWLRGASAWLTTGSVFAAFALSVWALLDVQSGVAVNANLYDWIASGGFRATVGMLLDPLAAVMLLVVTSVSALVHLYSIGYMHGDKGYARFFAYLSLFTFSMIMLVLSNNLLLLYVFWEAVGLCSYLLIGHWYERPSAAEAAKKAFIVNRVGDFGFGLGILLAYLTFGTVDYAEIFQLLPQAAGLTTNLLGPLGGVWQVDTVTLIALLLFMGAVGKSAQLPLHTWLPDAMEGPTPVSALIHAATMVTAGVFMVARLHPIFDAAPAALMVVAVTGGVTALFAATIGLVQNDIKRIVAYSTVSQLGYMFLACGVGAYSVGIFHLMTHAYFKGLLFLASGSVIHALSGEQDIRKMGGLYSPLKLTALTFWIASLSISGFPLLAGFFSKDEILLKTFQAGGVGTVLWVVGTLTALLTAFYSFRLIYLTFHGPSRVDPHVARHIHESPPVMTVPLVLLAAASIGAGWVGIGFIPGWDRFGAFLSPVFGAPVVHHEGEGLVMGLSIAAAVGGLLFARHLYLKAPAVPERLAAQFRGLYQLFLNKYWVDEIYDALFVRPIKRLSDAFLWAIVDVKGIDGAVNGTAHTTLRWGDRLRKLQTGLAPLYAFAMVLGLVVAAGLFWWRG
jgi:NADH-quinone oxidoreductase subunit L